MKMNKKLKALLTGAAVTALVFGVLLIMRTPVTQTEAAYTWPTHTPTPTPQQVVCHRQSEDKCIQNTFNDHCPRGWCVGVGFSQLPCHHPRGQ
jgi:hypothetical protein